MLSGGKHIKVMQRRLVYSIFTIDNHLNIFLHESPLVMKRIFRMYKILIFGAENTNIFFTKTHLRVRYKGGGFSVASDNP